MSSIFSIVLMVVLGSCAKNDSNQKTETYFLSQTKKSATNQYLDRTTDGQYQYVLTQDYLADAMNVQTIALQPDEKLVVIEKIETDSLPIPGEVVRFGKLIFVKTKKDTTAKDLYLENRDYVRALKTTDQIETSAIDSQDPMHLAIATLTKPLAPTVFDINIDKAFLETKLKEFSGAVPTKIDGKDVTIAERGSSTGRNNARAWLRQEYEKIGFTASAHNYGSGINFVAEKKGDDSAHFFVISSHLDSENNAGADDNGGGTIAALAIAQAVKDMNLKINLRIVAFDQEELGLVGSKAYANYLKTNSTINNLTGLLNIEMPGFDEDNDGAFHAIDCEENTSAELTKKVSEVIKRDTDLKLHIVDACTDRSDPAAFWQYNRPAIVVSQNFFGGDSNPCYHEACDKVDMINFDYMQRLTTALARTTAEILVANE